jgi:hypothetical protein
MLHEFVHSAGGLTVPPNTFFNWSLFKMLFAPNCMAINAFMILILNRFYFDIVSRTDVKAISVLLRSIAFTLLSRFFNLPLRIWGRKTPSFFCLLNTHHRHISGFGLSFLVIVNKCFTNGTLMSPSSLVAVNEI